MEKREIMEKIIELRRRRHELENEFKFEEADKMFEEEMEMKRKYDI